MKNIGTIDVGGTHARFGVTTSDGRSTTLKAARVRPESFESFAQQIPLALGEMDSLAGLSICVPGPVRDSKIGEAPNLPWLSGSHGFDLRSALEEHFSLPCRIYNDMVAAALGECLEHDMLIEADTLMVTLSTGIGGCRIRTLPGGQIEITPMELGHCPHPDGQGEICGCTKRNCFEALCSGGAALRIVRSFLPPWVDQRVDACAYLDEQAAAANELALSFYERFGEKTGKGLALILNALPAIQRVIYTGSFGIHAMKFMEPSVRRTLASKVNRPILLLPAWSFGAGPHKGCAFLFRADIESRTGQVVIRECVEPEQLLTGGGNANPVLLSESKQAENKNQAEGLWPDGFPADIIEQMRAVALNAALRVLGRAFAVDAEDIAQEVVADACARPQGIRKPVSWARTVARRRAINIAKRQAKIAPLDEAESNQVFEEEASGVHIIWLEEFRASFQTVVGNFKRLFDGLEPNAKEIIRYRRELKLQDSDISALTGLSPAAVRQCWSRSLRKLHKDLLQELKRGPARERELFLEALSDHRIFDDFLELVRL